MKKLYKIIGLLIVVTLIAVGCSSEDSDQTEGQETNGAEEEIEREEDPIEDEKDQEDQDDQDDEKEEDKSGDLEGEIKSQALIDIMNAKEFTMKMKMITTVDGQETESVITNAASGDKTYSLVESGKTIMNVIEKDDKSYVIMDESKTIIQSNRHQEEDEAEENITADNLVYDDLKYIGKGKEEFLGKQRSYEEYSTEVGNVKYYFDGKKLAGMKMDMDMSSIFEDELEEGEDTEGLVPEETTIKVEVLSFEKEADNSLFELPEDYQIVGQ